jgi:peptidoglycan/LPS O-acetylase OafA/YrhL
MESRLTYEQYRNRTYFPALDGIRAVCALLVVSAHMTTRGQTYGWLAGHVGVTCFFVLSGYLITMICLREEQTIGAVDIKAFYIRRSFRIFPLYFTILGLYCALIFLGSPERRSFLLRVLPYYVTYCNEFAPPGPFYQSWSLGMEEKYYILWPIVAFVALRARPKWRLALTVLMLLLAETLGRIPLLPAYCHPFYKYNAILLGCLVAQMLQSSRIFNCVRFLGERLAGWACVLLIIVVQLLLPHAPLLEALYPYCFAVFMISILLGTHSWGTVLSRPVAVFLGRRSYGIYLVHTIVIAVVEAIIPAAGPWWRWNKLLALLLSVGCAVFAAHALHEVIESPCIQIGRRLSNAVRRAKPREEQTPTALVAT